MAIGLQALYDAKQFVKAFTKGYTTEGMTFAKDLLFQRVSFEQAVGQYLSRDDANLLALTHAYRGPGAEAHEVQREYTGTSFYVAERALKEFISDEFIAEMGGFNPNILVSTAAALKDTILLAEESAAAALAFSSTYMTSGSTLSGTNQWSDFANSTPGVNIAAAVTAVQKAIGRNPNIMVLGPDVLAQLVNHPDIKERFNYAKTGVPTLEDVRQIFNMPQLLVPTAVTQSAATNSFVWGKHALVGYSGQLSGISTAIGISVDLPLPNNGKPVDVRIDNDRHGVWVELRSKVLYKVLDAGAGYLYTNAVA